MIAVGWFFTGISFLTADRSCPPVDSKITHRHIFVEEVVRSDKRLVECCLELSPK